MEDIIKNCVTFSEAIKKVFGYDNGKNRCKFMSLVEEQKIDITHLKSRRFLYERMIKKCPVCEQEFETIVNHRDEKTTCSHSCSNTHFATSRNKPDRYTNYRTICFKSWKKECVVCGFDKVVEVHHLDHNHSNNDKHNLVPVCPNHHQMLHTSKWAEETRQEILKVVESR